METIVIDIFNQLAGGRWDEAFTADNPDGGTLPNEPQIEDFNSTAISAHIHDEEFKPIIA